MTQQAVIPTAVVTGQPIISADAAAVAEPTIEELAALVGEPKEEPAAEPLAEFSADGAPETVVDPAAEPAAAAPVEPVVDEAALERVEAAAKKAREGSRRYKETQARLAETDARARQSTQRAEQLHRENLAAQQREAEYLKDPYGELKRRGMTDVDLAKRAMAENSPEALTEKRLADAEAKAAAAEAKAIALENKIAEDKHNAIMESRKRQAEAELVSAAKDAESCPVLAKAAPETQLWAARQALQQIKTNGYETNHLTMPQVAEAANKWLGDHIKRLGVEVALPPAMRAASAAPPRAKPSGETLTNKQTQTRVVAAATWDSLTEEQQLAHIAAGLPDPVG